jgi:hypothetical protein
MFNEDVFQDFFSGFGFTPGGGRGRTRVYRNQPRQNRNVNIRLTLSIKEVYTACEKTISVRLPSGRDEIVNKRYLQDVKMVLHSNTEVWEMTQIKIYPEEIYWSQCQCWIQMAILAR